MKQFLLLYLVVAPVLVLPLRAQVVADGATRALAIQPGGLLSPGASIGRLALTRIVPPTLLGTTLMEIRKNGSTLTNDVLQVPSVFLYGGSLIVSNLGSSTLAQGDRFRLFHANGYSGSFSSLSLPPLPDGLSWINNLSVDGSIEVGGPPRFASIGLPFTNGIEPADQQRFFRLRTS